MPRTYSHLTEQDRAFFLRHGWLRVPKSIQPKYIDAWMSDLWVRLGMDPNDKSTWTDEYLKLPRHREAPVQDVCPEAWAKMCELVGGDEMIDPVRERYYGDQHIINFVGVSLMDRELTAGTRRLEARYSRAAVPRFERLARRQRLVSWSRSPMSLPTDPLIRRYRCFADSSNNALTVILCFTDIPKRGGGTALAEDSLKREWRGLYGVPR